MAKRMMIIGCVVGIAFTAAVTASDTTVTILDEPICTVDGAGTLATGDRFEGSLASFRNDGSPDRATGTWLHVTATGSVLSAVPEAINCTLNGARNVTVEGTGTWNGQPGYTFGAFFQDRDLPEVPTPSPDQYVLFVWSPGEPGNPITETFVATRTYSPSRWVDEGHSYEFGAQISIPATLPVTLGNPDRGWAWLRLVEHGSEASIDCKYRGNGSDAYVFVGCQRKTDLGFETDPEIAVGSTLSVASVAVHIQQGSSRHPNKADAQTVVTLQLTVTPFAVAPGTPVFSVRSSVATGDLRATVEGR